MNRVDILSLFESQFGVADVAQLATLGVMPRTISRARHRGTIVVVLPGVYRFPGAPLGFESKAMAVQLHCGVHSYLSGQTAAALYGFRGMGRQRITVTIRPTAHVQVPGWVVVRRCAWFDADDVATRPDGLRLSTPLLTLFGLASEFNDHRFSRAAEDAWHLGLLTPNEASDYLVEVRRSGRGGVSRFESWVESARLQKAPAASGLELDTIDAIRRVGLPEPERQHPLLLPTGELIHIDVAWPAIRLGVEPGHSWWHGGNLRTRADAARDRACGELGWQIVRLDESMKQDLSAVARQLKAIHDVRRRTHLVG